MTGLPTRTVDWTADTETGRALADDMLSKLKRDMIRDGEFRGVEVGFCQRIAEALRR